MARLMLVSWWPLSARSSRSTMDAAVLSHGLRNNSLVWLEPCSEVTLGVKRLKGHFGRVGTRLGREETPRVLPVSPSFTSSAQQVQVLGF